MRNLSTPLFLKENLYTGQGRKMIHLRTEGMITRVVVPENSISTVVLE